MKRTESGRRGTVERIIKRKVMLAWGRNMIRESIVHFGADVPELSKD